MFYGSTTSSNRPLPLKQRTSSLDTRRDYSHGTWWSLLGLLKIREYFVTVDNFSIWRRHLAWAMENGKDLRSYMTQRYGSSMVFMSLLLSTELAILFNSAPVTTKVREALREGQHGTISFWAGFLIMISALLTVLSLIALFTAWGMVNSIDEVNAHCIFRSSIGQYAAELPGRLIVGSIYSFLTSFMIFFFLLLPVGPWSIILSALTLFLFIHIVSTFSAFGRVIMHTGAMGNSRIFSPEYEEFLLPHTLHSNLLAKAQANLANNASIIRQYRRKQQPIDRHLTEDNIFDHLSGNTTDQPAIPDNIAYRPRADSTVRFADVEEPNNNNARNESRNFQHHRSLTPLSDTSSFRTGDQVPTPHIDKPVPSYSLLRKSSYGGPPKTQAQQRLPPPQTFPHHSKAVSSSSIEQWLQHTNQTGSSTSLLVGLDSERSQNEIPAVALDKTREDRAPTASSNSFARGMSPINSNSNSLTPSHSELSFDDRHLSEDERFALDYGDFEDNDNSDGQGEDNSSGVPSSPLRFDVERLTDEGIDDFRGSERQSLLGGPATITTNYQSSSPSARESNTVHDGTGPQERNSN